MCTKFHLCSICLCVVYPCVYAHAGMCLCVLSLFVLIFVHELMLSICMRSWQQYVFGYVHVCVHVCVWRGGREVSKVPRQNNEGKWIPDGLFFLFSLCCQWREASDKPLMGNRLTHSDFELCRQHRAAEFSLSPPRDCATLFLTTIALRKSSSVWSPQTTLCSYKSWQNNMTLSSMTCLTQGSAASPTETMVLCQLCLSCWVWDQPSLAFTCHVNDFFFIINICHLSEIVQFWNAHFLLNIRDNLHEHIAEVNPS